MIARRLYYQVKPYLPSSLRLVLRRCLAKWKRRSLQGVWPVLESGGRPPNGWWGWPGGKQFAFVLTHDVEGQRGFERVKQLAELELASDFRSSFNFVPEGEYHVSADLRRWLLARGFEIGVHDLHHDGSLYRSRADFVGQAPIINEYLAKWNATGFRAAFMFHNLDWIRELDIEYDASTFDTDPFEPQPEGVGTIFPFFVPPRNGRSGYVELPYTLVQDSTLFILLQEQTADIWKRKLDWIVQRGGMALVNVHPDYVAFNQEPASGWKFPVARYSELLSYVEQRYRGQYWNVVPKNLARWFRSQACCEQHSEPISR
jgi:hypothetical protein